MDFKEYLNKRLNEDKEDLENDKNFRAQQFANDKKATQGEPEWVGKNFPPFSKQNPPFFYIYDIKSNGNDRKDNDGNETYSALRKDNYRQTIHPTMVADLKKGNVKWWPEYLEWAKNNKPE